MKLNITRLKFSLPEAPLANYKPKMQKATEEVQRMARASGTGSDKFKRAFKRVEDSIRQGRDLVSVLNTSLDLRALALLFNTEASDRIKLSRNVLNKITGIRARPSSLLLEAILDYYLKRYDQLHDLAAVEQWLRDGKDRRGDLSADMKQLLGGNGPKWLAEESRRQGKDFDEQVKYVRLDRYISGRFLTVAKNIYYLDVLRGLEPNQSHPILDEMQKKSAYNSRYDKGSLLGHQILTILIDKAPVSGVSDTWLNVVLTIAGDPRVPLSHPNFVKWWSQIDSKLRVKVQGWLSKLDLRLFLEALEDFSNLSRNEELKRMYPARKHFMEGLLNKQLVTGTRLYLSSSAESYLKRVYKPEHLPNYSVVTDQGKSLIHIQLGRVHLVEGSHSCRLWIYDGLDASAIVFDYSKARVNYSSLTQDLAFRMSEKGFPPTENITHHPPLAWQNKALTALQNIGVPIESKDILTPEDYRVYKRRYGA